MITKVNIQNTRDLNKAWDTVQILCRAIGLYTDTENPDGIDINNLKDYTTELYHLMVAIRRYWRID